MNVLNIPASKEQGSTSYGDSLEKIIEGIEQAVRMKRTDFLGAISRFETLLERINKLDYDRYAQIYKFNYTTIVTHLANIYYYSSKYQKALYYTGLLEEASELYNDKKLKANALLQFGNIHSDLGEFPEAMRYSTDALEIFKELEDKEGMGSTNNNIGNVFYFRIIMMKHIRIMKRHCFILIRSTRR